MNDISKEFNKPLSFLKQELQKIRGNRANPDLLLDISVDAYDTKMALNQVATISIVDATLLTVEPWDKGLIEAVEKAIRTSDLNLSPVVDKQVIKVPLPALSEERREEFVKLAKQKGEEARISIRQIRHELMEKKEHEKEIGKITEDDLDRFKKDMQKEIDNSNKEIETILVQKEKELLTV